MALPSNLAPVDLSSTDTVKKYYNNILNQNWTVPANVDDTVMGFFETITGNKQSAKILASSIIFTSVSQGIDPMHTLHEFTKLKPGEITNYLAMFLNYNRVGTSLLGVSNDPQANKYVKRCILP